MPGRLRSLAFVLTAVVAAGCSGSTGIEGITTTTAATTSSSTATSSTSPATTTTTALVPVETVGCDDSDPTCAFTSAAGISYLEAEVTGGVAGFRVVRLGGGVVAAHNPERAFYPASSIKALQHLHAVRWVMDQPDPQTALATPIPVYADYCAGAGQSTAESLSAVLEAMMVNSDNQRADAVQDYFGRDAINLTATEVVGMTDTVLAHRFGCGGPANDPANRSTALDLSRLFEQVGLGTVLDPEGVGIFGSLMLGPPWPSLQAEVADAGEALSLDQGTVDAFQEGIDLNYKAGWWNTYLSVGGLLTLPAPACAGSQPWTYAFAAFVDGADSVAAGFDVKDLVPIVLGEEIKEALAAFADPSACGP
jgi:beta-lactamase class A